MEDLDQADDVLSKPRSSHDSRRSQAIRGRQLYAADIVGRAEILTSTCTSGTKASNTAYAQRMGGVAGFSSNLETVGILTVFARCKAPFWSSVVGRQ